jgi:hypothetical protein
MKTLLISLPFIFAYQFAIAQNNIWSDTTRLKRELRIQDSIIQAEYGWDSNAIKSVQSNWWVYDAQGNVIDGKNFKIRTKDIVKLVDSVTSNYFILDSNKIFITAYDKSNKIIWRTDPYKNDSIPEYRTKRPFIIYFVFGKSPDYFSNKIKEGLKVIWITYNNTQFGFIDIRNGKYYYCGQD